MSAPSPECTDFGYLSERSKEEQIPEKCITCPESIKCMLLGLDTSPNRTTVTDEWNPKGAGMDRYGEMLQPQHQAPRGSLFKSIKAFAKAHARGR